MKDAPHIGLARKHRPQQFKDVVGQEAVSTTLQNALEADTPAQAYLFFGPRGIGKTTSARILAKALNCRKGPTPTPCGKCPSCLEIASGGSIDVLELDAASNTQVDKIREMIIETVSLAPSRDRFKIFIIDEVHMLSTSSFNALLKTLEEPPAHAVFVLATTELAKIPATIVSRCQRFRFRPIPTDVMAGYLGKLAKLEKIKTEKSALELIARSSGGALRDGISLLDQVAAFSDGNVVRDKVSEMLGMLPDEFQKNLLSAVLGKDASKLAALMEEAAGEGFDATQLLRDLRERLQELYLNSLGVEGSVADNSWKALAEGQTPEIFSFLMRRVNRTLVDMRSADSPQLAFELGIYGMLESAYDLRAWIGRLEVLERRIASGLPAQAPAAPRASAPVAPRPAAVPVNSSSPVKTAAPPAGGSEIWPEVLMRLDETLPSVFGSLEGSRLVAGEGETWRVLFADAFSCERVAAKSSVVEKAVEEIAGKRIKLIFEVDATLTKAPRAESKKSGGSGGEGWPDSSAGSKSSDPGVNKVLGAFEGARVRNVRKKKGG